MLTRAIHFSPVSVMPPVFVNVRVDSIAEASFSDASAMVTDNSQESIRSSGLDSFWGVPSTLSPAALHGRPSVPEDRSGLPPH